MRLAIILLLGLLLPAFAAEKRARPNIVLILADDLGWADLGCYGNRFNETPNIDRLAKQGARFTDFYAAAPVCSPTRASIMTGLHPARTGMTAHIPGHWRPFEKLVEPPNVLELSKETTSLTTRLKQADYVTGYFGKWHLGGKGYGPAEFGFDTVYEFTGHSIPASRLKDQQNRRACDYLTELSIEFMETNRARPFFVQLSPYAVHIPLSTTPALQAKYEAKPKVDGYPCHPLYAGLLEELDTAVGNVLAALERLGLAENTLVIFTSDNGGLEREMGGWPGTSNRPLRNEKGSLYEGGIRVPFIASWPGIIQPRTTSVPAISTDLYPTFIHVAGVKVPRSLDGVSLLPLLRSPSSKQQREALYWHYPHYHHSRPAGAIRSGDWKLIEYFDVNEVELYNVSKDLGESNNLAGDFPEKADELKQLLRTWRRDVSAQMPRRNPAYNPARALEWWSRAKLEPTDAPGTLK